MTAAAGPESAGGGPGGFAAGTPLIRPVVFDRAFDDPEAVRDVLARNGPYEWIGLRTGSGRVISPTPLTTWFRETWDIATAGEKGRGLILENPVFVDGSRESFVGFGIVRPESVRINLMTPMPTQPAHFDDPYFRGLDHSNTPYRILMAMGRSGLFERWQVNVSSALAWLYDGEGGGFTYWAAGPDRAPSRIAPPMNNRALVSDNQRMYHRVEAIGGQGTVPVVFHDPAAVLVGDGRNWTLVEGDRRLPIARRDIRISLLWKAVMFRDAEDARVHDAHLDDLDLATALTILAAGARERGVTLPEPEQLYGDARFMAALGEAFPIARDLVEPETPPAQSSDMSAATL